MTATQELIRGFIMSGDGRFDIPSDHKHRNRIYKAKQKLSKKYTIVPCRGSQQYKVTLETRVQIMNDYRLYPADFKTVKEVAETQLESVKVHSIMDNTPIVRKQSWFSRIINKLFS